jgi:arginase family enzyme
VDAFEELRVVDFGDAAVMPGDARRSHAAIEAVVGEVLAAVLGGDHSITEPSVRACVATRGPVGVVHFDTHTDTGEEVFGVQFSHGTFMRTLVDDGQVDAGRYAQIGLRGYWPGEREFAWQAERGITSPFMHDVRDLGIREVVARALAWWATGRPTSRWTSTCSTRPSCPEPARPSRAASPQPSCCGRCVS